jgi:hypothetical protein
VSRDDGRRNEKDPRGGDGEHADRYRECNERWHDCLLLLFVVDDVVAAE